MRQWHSEFQARCWYDGTITVVELQGEIDIVAAESLAPRLRRLTAVQGQEVIVDLRPVTFMDCSGLGMLCALHERLVARGRRLRVVATRPLALKMLRLTGLHGAFQVHGSLREARSAAGAPLDPQPVAGRAPNGTARATIGAPIASLIPSHHRTKPRPDTQTAPSAGDG
ncbi:STAS domain-containing protein [Streptomyces zagrosensis]|uniref:Anti-sigma factor antagonist n=1 Tax=Streptomyces zagrosensis TaxID=1042984 RepID=A0A7W9UZC2_9ACTN|nr:STAS domain-containing protein [Streptomyces zagrosensis]MBB5936587.1 anti-anti-sigma factor [Streptomyces zagrosensis]